MITVYIDNNIWDLVFQQGIFLDECFPSDKFSLTINKHGWYEIEQTTDPEKRERLKKYVSSYVERGVVKEDYIFGFYNPSVPASEQRRSGFGMGRFGDKKENEERKRLSKIFGGKGKRKSSMIINKQEADIELGALSTNSYVITLDKKMGH